MNAEVAVLRLNNPVFQTYLIAASIMILKLMMQPWMTVARMMKAGGGFRSPEDLKKTPLNPNPQPAQLEINEYVDRSRRLNLNDLESIPRFTRRPSRLGDDQLLSTSALSSSQLPLCSASATRCCISATASSISLTIA